MFIFATIINAQNEIGSIDCEFWNDTRDNLYICNIFATSIDDVDNQNFKITGDHRPNQTNSDVTAVTFQLSKIPFVVPEIFSTFPNIFYYYVRDAGLNRIQSFAFVDAANVEAIRIIENPLTSIEAFAFTGATKLRDLILEKNAIHSIHEQAFIGTCNIDWIMLNHNAIQDLPPNVFRPLQNIQDLYLYNNTIQRIDGRTFASNSKLKIINLKGNEIHAIERNFLRGLQSLIGLNLEGNRCANEFFYQQPLTEIEAALSECFDNFDRN